MGFLFKILLLKEIRPGSMQSICILFVVFVFPPFSFNTQSNACIQEWAMRYRILLVHFFFLSLSMSPNTSLHYRVTSVSLAILGPFPSAVLSFLLLFGYSWLFLTLDFAEVWNKLESKPFSSVSDTSFFGNRLQCMQHRLCWVITSLLLLR